MFVSFFIGYSSRLQDQEGRDSLGLFMVQSGHRALPRLHQLQVPSTFWMIRIIITANLAWDYVPGLWLSVFVHYL